MLAPCPTDPAADGSLWRRFVEKVLPVQLTLHGMACVYSIKLSCSLTCGFSLLCFLKILVWGPDDLKVSTGYCFCVLFVNSSIFESTASDCWCYPLSILLGPPPAHLGLWVLKTTLLKDNYE